MLQYHIIEFYNSFVKNSIGIIIILCIEQSVVTSIIQSYNFWVNFNILTSCSQPPLPMKAKFGMPEQTRGLCL